MSGTTSPAAVYATTPFINAEKVDIRRFCGYPTYGAGMTGFQSWRFFTEYGLLEYRMNNFAPEEVQNCRYILTQLYALEAAVWGSGANLDTDQAAVWKHNRDEVAHRAGLYRRVRLSLCTIVGVPPGPQMNLGASFDVVI
jgi:hypothetical protein